MAEFTSETTIKFRRVRRVLRLIFTFAWEAL